MDTNPRRRNSGKQVATDSHQIRRNGPNASIAVEAALIEVLERHQ